MNYFERQKVFDVDENVRLMFVRACTEAIEPNRTEPNRTEPFGISAKLIHFQHETISYFHQISTRRNVLISK